MADAELDVVRSALDLMLSDYVKEPFFWLREADLQWHLAARLHEALSDTVEIGQYVDHGSMEPTRPYAFDRPSKQHKTSRVHREIKVTPNGRSAPPSGDVRGSNEATDIVLLRKGAKVSIVRFCGAAFNATAHMFSRDVRALIEIKHDHTGSKRGESAFVLDLLKLARSCAPSDDRERPHGFFLGIDTSQRGKNTTRLLGPRAPRAARDWSGDGRFARAGLFCRPANDGSSPKAIVESYDLSTEDDVVVVRHLHWFRSESR